MKSKFKYLIAALSLVIVISAVIFTRTSNDDSMRKEKSWYAKNLGYEFCGIIVDREELNQKWGYGKIRFSTLNKIETSVEDSLNLHLIHNESLRFIETKGLEYQTICQNISRIEIGDSICISSENNSMNIYRKGKLLSNKILAENLVDRWFK